jgi:hypothetical protein
MVCPPPLPTLRLFCCDPGLDSFSVFSSSALILDSREGLSRETLRGVTFALLFSLLIRARRHFREKEKPTQ